MIKTIMIWVLGLLIIPAGIILYYWNNYSYEEIAQIINKPIGTVRTWLFRSKEMIRKDLNGQVR